MQKLDEFKFACPKCETIIIVKANRISQSTLEGRCCLCNEPIGKQLIKVKGIIDTYNSCCDELRKLSNVEIIAKSQ